MRNVTRSVLVCLAASGLAACGSAGSGAAPAPNSTTGASHAAYNVIAVADLSGESAATNGGMAAYGAKAYFDMINSQGGVNGHKINYIVLDSQSSATGAVAAYHKALSYNPIAIIQAGISVEFAAASPVATTAHIPVIATGGMADSEVYPPRPYIFEAIPSAYQTAYGELEFAIQQAKAKGIADPRIALTAIDSAYGANYAQDVVQLQSRLGFKVVSSDLTALNANSFSSGASKFAAAKPDYIVAVQNTNFMPVVASDLTSDGVNAPVINFFGGDSPALYQQLNDPNYYVMRPVQFPATPSLTQLNAAAKKAGVSSYETGDDFTASWIEAQFIAQAIRQGCTGSITCNGATIEKTIQSGVSVNSQPNSFGPFTANAHSHTMVSEVQPVHYVNGSIVDAGSAVTVTSSPS